MPTYAACLTPPGSAAIAVVGVRGTEAWTVVRALFRPAVQPDGPLPETVPSPRFWFGKLTGAVADEVVLVVRQFEPVPSVEIHCHGGRQVVELVLKTLVGHGVEVCPWQQLERLSGDDPLRSEAAIALAEARTTRTAGILLEQYHGAFARAWNEVESLLQQGETDQAAALLEPLVQRCALGRHLTIPWQVVIAGPPNVGKSSLVNALAGYQRSVVSPVPGTTRDVVGTTIAIDGWPVELFDTAGLHAAGEDLEKEGIERAQQAIASADLCLWLLDASAPAIGPGEEIPAPLLVINKIDLPPAWPLVEATGAVPVSARTGEGLEDLCDAINRRLVPAPPPPGAAVPFTPELCDQVSRLAANRMSACR